MLHGCVPVIIMDGTHVVFETILDWSKFSVRIQEKDINSTIDVLLAIKPRELRAMQAHLARVWNRCVAVLGVKRPQSRGSRRV